MSTARPYVDSIIQTSKSKGKPLSKAIDTQRPFDGVDYTVGEIKTKREAQIQEISAALSEFTIPPKNENERKAMITGLSAIYQKIGNEIRDELRAKLQEDGEVVDEKKLLEAARNYLFNLGQALKLRNGYDKNTEIFLNDLTTYYHENDPVTAFDDLYKSRLLKAKTNINQLIPYMDMVNKDYFQKILHENQEINNNFFEFLSTFDLDSQIQDKTDYKINAEAQLRIVTRLTTSGDSIRKVENDIDKNIKLVEKQIKNFDKSIKTLEDQQQSVHDKILALKEEIDTLKIQIRNGYTAHSGTVSEKENELSRLESESSKIVKALSDVRTSQALAEQKLTELKADKQAIVLIRKEIKSGIKIDYSKKLNAATLALQDANDKLEILRRVPAFKSLVQGSNPTKTIPEKPQPIVRDDSAKTTADKSVKSTATKEGKLDKVKSFFSRAFSDSTKHDNDAKHNTNARSFRIQNPKRFKLSIPSFRMGSKKENPEPDSNLNQNIGKKK